jgi:hypothetical protein
MLSLVEPLLGTGLILFMDNFYSVATLVQKLKTYCVETLCLNMKAVPETEER